MIAFPNCKINIGLRVNELRKDGYHNIETIFFPLPWKEAIEVVETTGSTVLTESGIPSNASENNICLKAYQLIRCDFPDIPSVKIHLHKTIPAGAGLGGGSADGTFMLQLLNEKFELNLTNEQLSGYALQLGSDCPFFLLNSPAYATGRGEIFQRISLNLEGYFIKIIFPGITVSTKEAFKNMTLSQEGTPLTDLAQQPVATWKETIFNDFEKTIFPRYPLLKEVKEDLYREGAVYASLTGTGSALYGIFNSRPAEISSPTGFLVKVLAIK